jgi:hypothetical protein
LFFVLAGVTSSVAVGSPSPGKTGNYQGSAKNLVPTASQAKYDKIAASTVTFPSAGKRAGIRSAWEVKYQDRLPVAIADVTIYVYDNSPHALAAYRDACTKGCQHRTVKGFETKYVSTHFKGLPVVTVVSHCRNVYVAVITTATSETLGQLGYDAGFLIGVIYAKAKVYGLGAC